VPRTTEDIAKELFAKKQEDGYVRADIVTYHNRDGVVFFGFIKDIEGYETVFEKLCQCIVDGDHPIGMVFVTTLPDIDDAVGIESYIYPEYEPFEWAREALAVAVEEMQKQVPGLMGLKREE